MQAIAPDVQVPERIMRVLTPLYERVRAYHDYRVVGLEHLPARGPALVCFTHSLATYDILLFGAAVYLERQRLIAALVDRRVMQTPGLSHFARAMTAVQGEPGAARRLLDEGRIVGVAPGGMREALRPKSRRYQVDWEGRRGFARLALEAQVPVVMAACPRADDLYTVVDNPLTRWAYERLRLPVPVAFGRRLTGLPRPVRLVHVVSQPVVPPRLEGGRASDGMVKDFQAQLVSTMSATIEVALQA